MEQSFNIKNCQKFTKGFQNIICHQNQLENILNYQNDTAAKPFSLQTFYFGLKPLNLMSLAQSLFNITHKRQYPKTLLIPQPFINDITIITFL